LAGADPTRPIDDEHVATPHGSERVERSRDLALDVEDPGQACGQPGIELDGEISHRTRV
jgi:hypothetical protein